ncbi:MAG TPA: hypothetical protein VGP85_00030 [Pyrinomonadaceae bacterium]|jgi:hypothetical protein|nr:hypothetical protein [Pyrinomonadaceae bacterium]
MSVLERETVHTVNDYCDGPRVGVADFKGQPHYFECIFDEAADDWSSNFWLHSLEPETFNLVMENWSFWERWRDAFDDGKADGHPCLPGDQAKYQANTMVLKERLRIDRESDIRAQGLFEIVGPPGQPTNKRQWTVTWQEIP